MPEGDTIFRTAAVLTRALAGAAVTGFRSPLPAVQAAAEQWPVPGRVVESVEATGKHLWIRLAAPGEGGALLLHTHLQMTGSWHIYRPEEPWRKPRSYAKVVLETAERVAPCFSAPVVELLTEAQAARHPARHRLGPDAITSEFDAAEAVRRLRMRGADEIAVALLAQTALAGVGNVFKCEILFTQRLSPVRRVRELDDEVLTRVVEEARRLLLMNRGGGLRRTRHTLDRTQRLWVYGRVGEPCRECGQPIEIIRQGADLRLTYFCPRCQTG